MSLEAVVFDWAGTVIDFGSLAPVRAFQSLMERNGVAISLEEVRAPMGLEKRAHIQALLDIPRVQEAWEEEYGAKPGDDDVSRLYADLIPVQMEQIALHTNLIDGVVEVHDALRERGIKLGSTTGYSRGMIGEMLKQAEDQGFTVDCVVASDDIGANRPAAAGALKNLAELSVTAVANCVKVDDTAPGIEEGLNAGMWSIGVALTGNALGMSQRDWQEADESSKETLRQLAHDKLAESGAHYIIDSAAGLLDTLAEIEERLCRGEKP